MSAPGIYGDYLPNAQGEDVVAGIRNTLHLQDLRGLDERSYTELLAIMSTLESHYRDLCDIEFTIERGKLWMLQTRVGKRTAGASFRIAAQLVDEGVIDLDEALRRVSGAQLAQLMFPRFDPARTPTPMTRGVGASPGAAVGKAVFTAQRAVELASQGESVILVRRETNPDDLSGMIAAQGILTARGGKTSHAAVVARGMGRACVCGAGDLAIPELPHRGPYRTGLFQHGPYGVRRVVGPRARATERQARATGRRAYGRVDPRTAAAPPTGYGPTRFLPDASNTPADRLQL